MATPLEALQNKASSITSQLQGSNTAYTPNTVPTYKDANLAIQLASVKKQIEDAKSTNLRNTWYGKADQTSGDTTAVSAPKDSWWMSGLKAIQKPLNAIAGTAQYALGKGTSPTLASNVNEAMKTGLTFGNVLNQEGVTNRLISAPLGFALDIALDPVNWLTMGTSALVPRVGMGLIKGGIERGAVEAGTKAAITGFDIGKAVDTGVTGLTSNLAQKATSALNMIPMVKTWSKLTPVTEEMAREAGQEGLTLGDKWRNLLQKTGTGVTETASKLGEKAIAGAEKYDTLMGTDVYSKINKGMFGQPTGIIGKTVEDLVNKVPSVSILGKAMPSGEDIVKFFKYSPSDAARIADLKDQITNLGKDTGLKLTHATEGLNFLDINEALAKDATVNIDSLTKRIADTVVDKADTAGNILIRDQVTGAIIPELHGQIKVANTIENAKSLLGTAMDQVNLDHLAKVYQRVEPGKTGVQWYDDVIDKAKATTFSDIANFVKGKLGMEPANIEKAVQEGADETIKTWNTINGVAGKIANINPGQWKPFEGALTGLEKFTSLFKAMKVPYNVGSHVVANVGNFFMGAMMGLPVWEPEYMNSLMNAKKLLSGKLGITGIKEMFFNDTNLLITMADENPTRFRQLFGFDPSEIVGKISVEDKIAGVIPTKMVDVRDYMQKAFEEAMASEEEVAKIMAKEGNISSLKGRVEKGAEAEAGMSKIEKKAMQEKMGAFPTASESVMKKLKEGTLTEAERGGTFTTEELNANLFDKTKSIIAENAKAHPNNPMYFVADKVINSMPKWYEHIDQTFKVGSVDYMSRIGLTEQQLITLSRTVPFSPEDILEPIIKNGQKLYRLKPLKASEVAMETYMNYAAMPDFVKIMRALPIAGSNFYSFQYAMAIKSAKTAINNLSSFNKIGFMLNEITGTRSPEEKIAMQNKYNQYLDSPTVVKIMGMWNTDVKNMIPIYGMNMFNPSEKSYSDTPQGNLLKMSDNIPLFQTPVGQVLKDYWIQPWILSGTGEAPQGQFGQPLYPTYDEKGNLIDASALTKLLYAGRTLGEAVVPGVASYAGLPLGMANVSPDIINLIPSYGARSVANAAEGRSSIGAMTKEDAVRKTLRSLAGRTGIPLYTLDTTNISTKDLSTKK
jgi:hypothetical protein